LATIKSFNDEDQQSQPGSSQQSSYIQQQGSSPFSNQKSGSQNFQNLQKFMNANKNIDMQTGIIKNIQGQGQALNKSLGQSQEKFIKDVNPEKERLSQAEQTAQSALSNYQNLGANPNAEGFGSLADEAKKQISDVQKLRRGEFKSDFQVQDLPKQEIATNRYNTLTAGAGTEQGRFNILNKAFSGLPGYTSNLARVDQLLLQSAGADKAKNFAQQLGGFGQQSLQKLNELKSTRDTENAALKALGTQAQTKVAGMLSNEQSNLDKELQDRATQYKTQIADKQKSIQDKFKNGEALTQDDVNTLKMKPDEEFVKFYNANRTQTVTPDRAEITARQGLGTEADITKYLQSLGTEDITNTGVANQQNLLKSYALSRLAEYDPSLQQEGKYGQGYNMQDFMALQKEPAVTDIEKAFELNNPKEIGWSSAGAQNAMASNKYNPSLQSSQQYLAGLGGVFVESNGRSVSQALSELSRSEPNKFNVVRGPEDGDYELMGRGYQPTDAWKAWRKKIELLEGTLHGANTSVFENQARSDALRKMIETGQLKDIGQVND
jgi:hypothetical protein